MKRSGCKTLFALLFVQVFFFMSATAFSAEVEKKYSKEYSTSEKELLAISNKYGEVIIENWNENRIQIDVLVTVEHPSQDKAEKYLSMIDILFSDNDNTIRAETDIDSKFSFRGGAGRSFSIDYLVKMPVDFNVDLSNKYGNVEIEEIAGHADIAVKYGSLFVARLSRGNEKPLNSISLAYGKGEIVESGWTEVTLRYVGKLNIGTAKALLVDSRYSKLYVDEAGSVVNDSKYDHVKIDMVNNFVAEGGYTGFELGTVSGKLDIETGYGSIMVEEIEKDFKSVDIEAKYCQVKMGFEENASYRLKVRTSYGGVSFDEENAEIINRIYENNRKSVEAVIGDKNAKAEVNIVSSYGSVKVY